MVNASRFLILSALGAATFGACKARQEGSPLRVVGGLDDTTGLFPNVVSLRNAEGRPVCTGTVIGRRAVLTAAHCIQRDKPLYLDGKAEAAALVARAYAEEELGVGDVAVLLYRDDLSQTPRTLSTSEPSRGTTLTIVGFGCDGTGRGSSGVRRYGENALFSVDPAGPLVYVRGDDDDVQVPGKNVSSCAGDSGGPILNGAAVAAVTSGNDGRYNFGTWLGSAAALALLRVAASDGGGIDDAKLGPPSDAERAAVERLGR